MEVISDASASAQGQPEFLEPEAARTGPGPTGSVVPCCRLRGSKEMTVALIYQLPRKRHAKLLCRRFAFHVLGRPTALPTMRHRIASKGGTALQRLENSCVSSRVTGRFYATPNNETCKLICGVSSERFGYLCMALRLRACISHWWLAKSLAPHDCVPNGAGNGA